MKPLTHCLLLFITLLCLAASCKDDDMPPPPEPIDPDGLPLPTQTGENTFGCLVNGEPWIAEITGLAGFDPLLRPLDMTYDEVDFGLSNNNNWILRAKGVNDSISESFVLRANSFQDIISLNEVDNEVYAVHRTSTRQFNEYLLDLNQPYNIETTKLDTLENICSGVFEFYALSTDQSDTLHITKGRFDKKYSPE